jgi:hypothetical protein
MRGDACRYRGRICFQADLIGATDAPVLVSSSLVDKAEVGIMRSKLLGLLLGCGLVAATIAPAFACDYQTNASNDSPPPQQSAQAQTNSSSQ